MNDMIENTNTKQKLIEFQQIRRLGTYGFEKGQVTSVLVERVFEMTQR
jgi:hypothetical protein